MALLEVRDLAVSYGDLEVVHGVDFDVDTGEVVSLLGANGAGKSSIMWAISGLLRPSRGSVKLDGNEISAVEAHKVVELGLRHVPEGRRIFGPLSVEENLKLGGYSSKRDRGLNKRIEEVYERFPILGERRKQLGGTLSGGEQQMLAVGRALVTNPRVIAFDEPSLGLSPKMGHLILDTISEVAAGGTAVLLVEQNAKEALRISKHAYVLDLGEIVIEGPAAEVAADPRIQATYLGGDLDEAQIEAADD